MNKYLKITLILLAWVGFVLLLVDAGFSPWFRYPLQTVMSFLVGMLIVEVYHDR